MEDDDHDTFPAVPLGFSDGVDPVILGMGALGDSPANKIPVPDKKFTVTFIDQMDVVTK